MIVQHRVQLVSLLKERNLPLVAVEVGVAESRFSEELMNAGLDKLYLVDIWQKVPFITGCASFEDSWHKSNEEQTREKFKKEIKDGSVVMLKGFSYQMAKHIPDNSLGLVYIDCDHTYNGVRTDIDYYLPKLVKGGIMAFHDYDKSNTSYGVVGAVNDFTKGHGIVEIHEDGRPENMGAYFIKE
jgi:hypothetical protein